MSRADPLRIADYLQHVIEAIDSIQEYTAGMARAGTPGCKRRSATDFLKCGRARQRSCRSWRRKSGDATALFF